MPYKYFMGEYEFRDNLVTLANFSSATEAALAQSRLEQHGISALVDGDVASTMLNHVGPGLVSARVVVRQGDLSQAREILQSMLPEQEHPGSAADEPWDDAWDEDDLLDEDWADDPYEDDPYDEEPYSEEPATTPPVTRAFRAAVLGAILFPPLLTVYSLSIIVRHRLWEPQPGEHRTDYRVYLSLLFNGLGFYFAWLLYGVSNW